MGSTTLDCSGIKLRQFFDVRPGEGRRIGLMAAGLFFLLAANSVIKIVRDSLFLSRFAITQLPYVYLLAAVLAAAVIGIYSRYTSTISLSQVILRSYAFIISNVIIFWVLIIFLISAGSSTLFTCGRQSWASLWSRSSGPWPMRYSIHAKANGFLALLQRLEPWAR